MDLRLVNDHPFDLHLTHRAHTHNQLLLLPSSSSPYCSFCSSCFHPPSTHTHPVTFMWSLREGAKAEEVVIVEEKRKVAAAAKEQEQGHGHGPNAGGGDADRSQNFSIELVMSPNPMAGRFSTRAARVLDEGPTNDLLAQGSTMNGTVDASSLIFAKSPMPLPSARRSGAKDRQTSPGDGDGLLSKSAAAVAEAARVAREEEREERERATAQAEAEEENWAEDANDQDGEEVDVWTLHYDEASGCMYRYNAKTGETAWNYEEGEQDEDGAGMIEEGDEEEDAGAAVRNSLARLIKSQDEKDADEGNSGEEDEEEDDDSEVRKGGDVCGVPDGKEGVAERQVSKEEVDDLAMVRARLRHVLREVSPDDDGEDAAAANAAYQSLISDTRGDWVEVLDHDGSVLGASLAGRTVYYNRTNYETRMTKPRGWVLLQARALSKEQTTRKATRRKSPFLSSFRMKGKPAPVHRQSSKIIGRRYLKRNTSSKGGSASTNGSFKSRRHASRRNTSRVLGHHASSREHRDELEI